VVQVDDALQGSARWRKDETCRAHEGLFTCKCGRSSFAVTPYGRMNLCVSLPMPHYDLRRGTIAEGWKTLVGVVDRANAAPGEAYQCPQCPVQSHCRQGPMNAWLERHRLDSCLPYFKELATLDQEADEAARARRRDC
jgi:radical SAM protein with 4Fe4S-binding SPASM domain